MPCRYVNFDTIGYPVPVGWITCWLCGTYALWSTEWDALCAAGTHISRDSQINILLRNQGSIVSIGRQFPGQLNETIFRAAYAASQLFINLHSDNQTSFDVQVPIPDFEGPAQIPENLQGLLQEYWAPVEDDQFCDNFEGQNPIAYSDTVEQGTTSVQDSTNDPPLTQQIEPQPSTSTLTASMSSPYHYRCVNNSAHSFWHCNNMVLHEGTHCDACWYAGITFQPMDTVITREASQQAGMGEPYDNDSEAREASEH
ncbi:hypothetical protein F5Y19DRAFT_478262 [Xylariaceae sp. FL1651]|nr:hypothetical protein F5Y19DRAFT_478262 [Xylariaceae sp. FL1651]